MSEPMTEPMPTVTIKGEQAATHATHATPSAQLVADAAKERTIHDESGRAIKLRKPGVLAQFRLVEALGDASANQVYMGMTLPLLYVASIDGEEVEPLTSKARVEALIQRLDEHGVGAVATAVVEHYGRANPEADKDRLKK